MKLSILSWLFFLGDLARSEISSDIVKRTVNAEKDLAKVPPCSACSSLVKSFENGIERTSRGKFEGGDAAWEEKNQGKGYATSEVRFVEIQEKLCRDVSRGETQVRAFIEMIFLLRLKPFF